ncbi:hypothetical protein [Micromonospora sp. NPDC049282]|uniref:hypothetical protein n=1 Tax=Micromonospora sp. NPDC049282 TaxID=3364269 RepID=UPI0037117C85
MSVLSRARRAWTENLRARSRVSWAGFALEMAVVLALNVVVAGLLVLVGAGDLVRTLAVAWVAFLLGMVVLRLVVLATARRLRRGGGSD